MTGVQKYLIHVVGCLCLVLHIHIQHNPCLKVYLIQLLCIQENSVCHVIFDIDSKTVFLNIQ